MTVWHPIASMVMIHLLGNHFWAKGYCVDTVGVDADMIRKYVKHQKKLERNLELDFT